ncbi:MAG: 2-methylcitrate synthase 1 [Planctomycetota bacterium]
MCESFWGGILLKTAGGVQEHLLATARAIEYALWGRVLPSRYRGRRLREWSLCWSDDLSGQLNGVRGMDRSGGSVPAVALVDGLRRLVGDLRTLANPELGGLSEVICGRTRLLEFGGSSVGAGGVRYCGVEVSRLAGEPFEQTAWLLLHQSLPTDDQLGDWTALIRDAGVLEEWPCGLFGHLPAGLRPVELFPFSLQLLLMFDAELRDDAAESTRGQVWRLMGRLPIFYDAALNGGLGSAELGIESDLTWAGRLLLALRGGGELPTATEESAMNALLVCVCLTEMRPACFVSRLSASVRCGLTASLRSAAALFAAQLVRDPYEWAASLLGGFSGPSSAEGWLRGRERAGMPFGFASTVADERARILLEASESLLGSPDRIGIAAGAVRLERRLAAENLAPTIDWMAVRLMVLLSIPADRQSLLIGIARLIGWAGHAIEQQKSGVSLLPGLRYGDESGDSGLE